MKNGEFFVLKRTVCFFLAAATLCFSAGCDNKRNESSADLMKGENFRYPAKQFTSDASHELRTPVAVIISECEYMTDCAKSLDEMKESVYSVKAQAEKCQSLFQNCLQYQEWIKTP